MKRRTAKAKLSKVAGDLYSSIYDMTPRQRGAAARMLAGLTESNCAWYLYRLRPALLAFIDMASSSRALAAQARARAKGTP